MDDEYISTPSNQLSPAVARSTDSTSVGSTYSQLCVTFPESMRSANAYTRSRTSAQGALSSCRYQYSIYLRSTMHFEIHGELRLKIEEAVLTLETPMLLPIFLLPLKPAAAGPPVYFQHLPDRWEGVENGLCCRNILK